MIDIAIAALADDDITATVETDRKHCVATFVAGGNDRAEHTVLHMLRAETSCARFNEAGILQEDDAVTGSKCPRAALGPESAVLTKCALSHHHRSQRLVQTLDVLVGVGEHQQFVTTKTTVIACRG